MTLEIKHATQAAGTDAGTGEIRSTQWNQPHAITLATAKLLGRATAGTGAAEEIGIDRALEFNGVTLRTTFTTAQVTNWDTAFGWGNHASAGYLTTGAAAAAYQPLAAVLTATTASFTTADETKLDHITVTQAVDLDAIETRVNALDAAVVLKGVWDASGGSFPGSGTAQAGDSWIVSVGGTVDSVVFAVGDRVIAITDNASTATFAANWFKADYTDQVLSVCGRTGAVTIAAADIADSTSAGRAILTAADAAAQRTAMGVTTFDPASPGAIGGTTPAAVTATKVTVAGGTVTASAPVIDVAQTWNNSGVAFYGIKASFSWTAAGAGSRLVSILGGGAGTTEILALTSNAIGEGALTCRTYYATNGFFSNSNLYRIDGTGGGMVAAKVFIGIDGDVGAGNPDVRIYKDSANVAKLCYQGSTVNCDLKLRNLIATGRIDNAMYTTATRPAFTNGATIFDSDLDKLLVGGASAWEVVTSV